MKPTHLLLLTGALAALANAQVVGQTCGSGLCNPVFAAPPPSARALVHSLYVDCGKLIFNVYLVNDNKVAVRSPQWFGDTQLVAENLLLHPLLEREGNEQEIAPGSFVGPIGYVAKIPKSATGTGKFRWGPNPMFYIEFSTVNGCPKAEETGH